MRCTLTQIGPLEASAAPTHFRIDTIGSGRFVICVMTTVFLELLLGVRLKLTSPSKSIPNILAKITDALRALCPLSTLWVKCLFPIAFFFVKLPLG